VIDEAVQEKDFFLKNFIQINMAARQCDQLIICEQSGIAKVLGTCT